MSLTRYHYNGPPSGVELRLADGTLLEVQLCPGRLAELPADHEYTWTLLALQRLEPLAQREAGESTSGTRRTRTKKEPE
ncbi:hypothetical protein ACM7UF_17935 [Pseudomonas aeruginosa]